VENVVMNEEIMSTTLPAEIVDAELEVIRARRKSVYGDTTASNEHSSDISKNLCGLSISGGGIRSSTFSIGVIQSLAKQGLFKGIDYISTVSGGGYTGSMLSTLLSSKDETSEAFPPRMPVGSEEPKILQHLRNGSNYLTPGGFLSAVRLPALIVRGLIINLVLLLPIIMLLVFITEVLHEVLPVFTIYQYISSSDEGLYFFWITAGLISYFALSGFSAKKQAQWSRRNRYELTVAAVLLLLIATAMIGPVTDLIDKAIQQPWHDLQRKIVEYFAPVTKGVIASLIVIAILVTKASEDLSRIAGKLVLFLAGAIGPILLFCVYLVLVVAQVDSPFIQFNAPLVENVGDQRSLKNLKLTKEQITSFYHKDVKIDASSVTVDAVYCGGDSWILANPPNHDSELKIDDCDIPTKDIEGKQLLRLQPLWAWPPLEEETAEMVKEPRYELFGAKLHLFGDSGPQALIGDLAFILLTFVLLFLNYFFVNVNQCSLHGFYRDRLSKLYLVRRGKNDEVIHEDEIKLSELSSPGSLAPYHIINTTLNLQGNTQESQRGRGSDFFFFSKLYCGGTHTGYCETAKLEDADSHINLGTAMAISAAAAAPNMGSTTIKPLIFIMTLLNLRLGYWVPNPRFLNADGYIDRPWGMYLLREATGNLHANSRRVNVSDGGHLENLAIYEMLRRKCSTIVCIDGEADEGHTFNGLVTLIRIARIDLGIEIVIDLEKLRLKDDRCEEHFAIGTIIYGEGRDNGKLIYVKASYTAHSDNNPFLRKYKAEKPDFPHESTADQFFDERQFEAYRALGESIGRELATTIKSIDGLWPASTGHES
jgi:hypothetical protein